ncbi:MAG TPA: Uma2 family endonuclease [Pirellulaceae bacterium]|nr:Uma2 family endonuclease [Pirellulaceae bacterium]
MLDEPRPKRWSREEYARLFDEGFFAGQRVELIDGEILLMSPQGPDHASTIELVAEAVRAKFGDAYWVRIQMPLALSKFNEPEPDIAVVKGTPRTVRQHPESALLVVEVSGSTRNFDRGVKAREYALAGIQDYWVVDLAATQIIVHREPAEGQYRAITEHRRGDAITLLACPESAIQVADLLL